MIIRKENPNDYIQIYNLVKTAFTTAEVSNGKEQDFVNELRDSENYIPELSLVAELDGYLVGHIMLSKKYINDGDITHEILYLAPVSVIKKERTKGIGSQLINESFRIALEFGYSAVILVGNPAYYSRFGFKTSSEWNIVNTQGIPDPFVMACELVPGSLSSVKGTISF